MGLMDGLVGGIIQVISYYLLLYNFYEIEKKCQNSVVIFQYSVNTSLGWLDDWVAKWEEALHHQATGIEWFVIV